MKNIAAVLTLLICTISLSAQTSRTWTGSTSTDWNTASNWTPSGVPSSSDHITLSSASGNQPVLDANRSITNLTVSSGTIDLNGKILTITGTTSLTGGNINNGIAAFNNSTTTIAGTTFGAKVIITSGSSSITNTTFNSKISATQTSAGGITWSGNTYNDTLDYKFNHAGGSTSGVNFLNSTANGDVFVSSIGVFGIHFGSSTISTNKFTLAANKRIRVGSLGFSSNTTLFLDNIVFNDTSPFVLSLSGQVSIGTSSFTTTYNNVFSITSGSSSITNSTFNSKISATQTSAGGITWSGNTYNDTLDYKFNHAGGSTSGVNFLNSTANGDVFVSSIGVFGIHFGSSTISTNKFTLAANKRIKVGSLGFSSNTALLLDNIVFNDTSPFILSISGQISIGTSSFSTTYNNVFSITSTGGTITNATFNKKLLFTQTSAQNYTWTGNTYNDTLDYRYTGALTTTGIIFLNSTANGDVYISTTNQYNMVFGSATTSTNKFTLAANKRIKIGSLGWNSSSGLNLSNVEFNDTNPFTLSISGFISIGTSSFSTTYNNVFSITSTGGTITNATFNKKLLFTQTSAQNYTWTGNTYNDTLDYRYTGALTTTGISFLNSTANGDVYISTTNQYTMIFGSASVLTNKFTFAANKRIKIGSLGWNSLSRLNLNNVEFNDTNPFILSISGLISIGTSSFSTTYNNVFSITSTGGTITNATFNKKLLFTQTSAQNYTWTGNTYNDTLDYRYTGALTTTGISFLNSTANGDVYISTTNQYTMFFGSATTSTNKFTLAANKRIYPGSPGLAGSCSINLNNVEFNDTNPFTFSINNSSTANIGNSSFATTYNLPVSITSGYINSSKCTFNKKVILTKTGSGANYSYGGNTYNDTLDITSQAGILQMNYNASDAINGDLYVSSTGTGTIYIGSSQTSTLAAGKKIYIGSGGFASGALVFQKFIQLGTTDQSITLTGTSSLTFAGSQFNGRLTATTPNIEMSGATFNKKLILIKNGSGFPQLTGGNIFNDTTDYRLQNGNILFATSYGDTYNGNIIVSNTGAGTMTFGFHGSSTLASGKKIEVGSSGFATGGLTLNNFIQDGTTDQVITFTGTAGLGIGGSTFNGRLFVTAQGISIGSSTFNKKCAITKTGSSYQQWAGNTFNDTTEFNIQGTGIILTALNAPDYYNGDIILNSTAAGTLTFGYSSNSTLAAGKRIYVGSGGFSAGSITLTRFIQIGSTAQNITFSGGVFSVTSNSIFNGNLTISGPSVGLGSSTFNGIVTVTRFGSGDNSWGSNTFNGDVNLTNTGTGNFYASYLPSGSDNFNANTTFTKSGSGAMYLAGYNSTVYFKGNVTLNSISSAQQSGASTIVFTGNASQTINQSGGSLNFARVTINKASNDLTLSSPLTVSTALTLTSGKILTTSSNLLILADNATVSGASNSSYVEGPMSKTGNDAFTFPTGLAGVYRPLGISAPSSTATVFTAEYKNTGQALGSTLSSPLTRISNCEYWTLARSGTSSNAAVTLNWGTGSCETANPSIMKVASWNGSQWVDAGNASNTGTNTAGSVTTSSQSSFTAFTTGNGCTNSVSISSTPTSLSNVCPGVSVTLTSSSSTGNAWNTTATTQAINPTANGTYTVTYTDGSNCVAHDNKTVTFSTLTASITASPGTPINICETETVTLTANSATSYLWSPGGATTSSINPTTDGTYILTTYDAGGCSATDYVDVSFLLLPVEPTIPEGPIVRCKGIGTDNYATETDNFLSVIWSLEPPTAGTLSPIGESVSINWDSGYIGTATLTATAHNTCGDRDNSVEIVVAAPGTYYADFDNDGLGNPMISTTTCPQPDGYVSAGAGFDCDDNTADGE